MRGKHSHISSFWYSHNPQPALKSITIPRCNATSPSQPSCPEPQNSPTGLLQGAQGPPSADPSCRCEGGWTSAPSRWKAVRDSGPAGSLTQGFWFQDCFKRRARRLVTMGRQRHRSPALFALTKISGSRSLAGGQVWSRPVLVLTKISPGGMIRGSNHHAFPLALDFRDHAPESPLEM